MSRATTKILVGAVVAPEGTFTIPYPAGTVQADYNTPQDVVFDQAGVKTTASAAFGGSVITITWPANAAGNLQPGEYYIDLNTIGGDPLGGDVTSAGFLADSTAADDITDSSGGTAGATLGAISGSGADAGINNNFATLLATIASLEASHNALLARLQDAGLMEAS